MPNRRSHNRVELKGAILNRRFFYAAKPKAEMPNRRSHNGVVGLGHGPTQATSRSVKSVAQRTAFNQIIF
jgi:hypothetical protein